MPSYDVVSRRPAESKGDCVSGRSRDWLKFKNPKALIICLKQHGAALGPGIANDSKRIRP
jgi:hypothetical protein